MMSFDGVLSILMYSDTRHFLYNGCESGMLYRRDVCGRN